MNATCPLPLQKYPTITLAHGGGGRLMHQLIREMFHKAFGSSPDAHDSAVLKIPQNKIAFTTDSFVVRPLFFPGGDIGSLSIHGTVNDLAMSGAEPLWLTASFIIEEGLPMETLWKIVSSMARAAESAKVKIVTGDTKVVERGHGDGIYINTAGVGVLHHDLHIHPHSVRAGDIILLSGDVGRHGMAVMSSRESLEFETTIQSDSAPVAAPVLDLLKAGLNLHCLRDCTRGGLITTLNEIASSANLSFEIHESAIPIQPEVQGACEMLGLDPFYVANEGAFVIFVAEKEAKLALEILKSHIQTAQACQIGQVLEDGVAPVLIKNTLGTRRIAPVLSGEQLPRIC